MSLKNLNVANLNFILRIKLPKLQISQKLNLITFIRTCTKFSPPKHVPCRAYICHTRDYSMQGLLGTVGCVPRRGHGVSTCYQRYYQGWLMYMRYTQYVCVRNTIEPFLDLW